MRALLALLVLLSVVAGTGVVSAAVNTVTVSDVQVTPEQPNPGETFTVRVELTNAEAASGPVTVTDVAVRRGGRDVDRVQNPGSIPAGGTLPIPLTASFDGTGTRELNVLVAGFGPGGNLRLDYPVVVRVRPGGPQLNVDADEAVVGTDTRVTIQAVNGEDTPVRNVRLSLAGDGASVANRSRILPSLPAGGAHTFAFRVTPDATAVNLTATMRYTTETGDARTLRQSTQLAADPVEEDVTVDATVGDGAQPPVTVAVTNLGNAPLEEVVASVGRDGETLARKPVREVPPGETRRVTVNVSGVDEATLDVAAAYETGTASGRAETTVGYTANPGRIELTGVDVEREGTGDAARLHISGSTSNVGLSEARGVVVRVVAADGVRPARPNREYFVGTVPASDFVSFDLFARVDDGVEVVPVSVTYLVDGERRQRVVDVDVGDLPAEGADSRGPGLPNPLLLGGGALALLLLVAVLGYAWYRR